MFLNKIEMNGFEDFSPTERDEWLKRLKNVSEKHSYMIQQYGPEFLSFTLNYVVKNAPDFKIINEYLNEDKPLTDEVLVIMLPIMEDAVGFFLSQKD